MSLEQENQNLKLQLQEATAKNNELEKENSNLKSQETDNSDLSQKVEKIEKFLEERFPGYFDWSKQD